MDTRIYLFIISVGALWLLLKTSNAEEPVYYVSTEHVNVTYCNTEYAYLNLTASRYGRQDFKYYVHGYLRNLVTADNNVTLDFWFYEFLSNEYRRGFVEMHYKLCDLLIKDIIFGPALRANLPSCPFPPGEYRMYNMSIPELPLLRTFPFRKGRIYCSINYRSVRIVYGYIDMEIKLKPKRPIGRKLDRNSNHTQAK